MIQELFNLIIGSFDIGFIIACNILTYITIKFIDNLNGNKAVPRFGKRLILIIAIVIVAVAYYASGYGNTQVLINSAITAPIAWSWILKPIAVKAGIDYKKIDNTLN